MSDFSDDDGLQQAMDAQSSPIISRKRPRTIDDLDEVEDDNATNNSNRSGSVPAPPVIAPTTSAPINKNLLAVSKLYAQKKKLRTDQLLEVDGFLSVSLSFDCNPFANVMLHRMTLANVSLNCSSTSWHWVTSWTRLCPRRLHIRYRTVLRCDSFMFLCPTLTPSDRKTFVDLHLLSSVAKLFMPIKSQAPSMLFSCVSPFSMGERSDIICGQDMLKTHRFDLPPGIEKNRADWQKVVSATDYELTQARAKFKKEVSV
jgi:hypothetical protein